jgi:hypothetical protein
LVRDPLHRLNQHVRTNLSWWVLVPLLAGDGICALVFLAHFHVAAFASDRWDLSLEGSWPEWYGHIVELAIVGLLFAIYRRTRQSHHLAWMAVFLYVGLDDTVQLHEHAGKILIWLSGGHDNRFGIRLQDIGELISWAIAGTVFCYVLWRTYRRASAEARADGLQLAAALGLLVFCGMFLDTADRVINPEWHQLVRVAIIVEDGGELVALSFALASIVAFWQRVRASDPEIELHEQASAIVPARRTSRDLTNR